MGWASAVSSYRAKLQVCSLNEDKLRCDWPGWPPDFLQHLRIKTKEFHTRPIITPLQVSNPPQKNKQKYACDRQGSRRVRELT